MWASGELRPLVTEYRVGTYAFHDRATVAAGAAELDDVALTVHATVVSRPASDRAVLDAGSKALTSDPGPDDGLFGAILEAPGARIVTLNEEHAYVQVGASSRTTRASSLTSSTSSLSSKRAASRSDGPSTHGGSPAKRSLAAL